MTVVPVDDSADSSDSGDTCVCLCVFFCHSCRTAEVANPLCVCEVGSKPTKNPTVKEVRTQRCTHPGLTVHETVQMSRI
jgi:hypothetical protein